MNQAAIIEIGRESMWVVLKVAGPIMMAGLMIGLVIALFQALTSIQEMTLTFVPKILVIFLATILFLPVMITSVVEFAEQLFDRVVALG